MTPHASGHSVRTSQSARSEACLDSADRLLNDEVAGVAVPVRVGTEAAATQNVCFVDSTVSQRRGRGKRKERGKGTHLHLKQLSPLVKM